MEFINISIHAIKECTKKLNQKEKFSFVYTNHTDPSSSLDLNIENTIKSTIKQIRPKDGIIGEESGSVDSESGVRWIIDPIDGTMNFLHNIPHWCISIACEQLIDSRWITITGVVYDVFRNELFTSVLGSGAKLNNYPIKISNTNHLRDSLIATELSYNINNRNGQISTLAKLVSHIKDIRSTGSSALDICWVANGRFDAFFESDLSYWDWAAAALILKEAGGKFVRYDKGLIATNTLIHKQLIKKIT